LKDNHIRLSIFLGDDLWLDYPTRMDYYCLRFQIEFDFRDAKQPFGLCDFKNYQQQNLTSFVNLSFLMGLISKMLLEQYRSSLKNKLLRVRDRKILFNARNTAKKLCKLTQTQPDIIFNEAFCDQFLPDDLIHAA
jgi:putative transposase